MKPPVAPQPCIIGRTAPQQLRDLRVEHTATAATLIAFELLPATTRAETAITTQAVADNGAFLPYAPAPAQLGGLCRD